MKKLSVAGRQYKKQDGSQATEWTNVGILNVAQNGKEYILLDPKVNLAALPVGENGMIMVGVFEETQNQNQQGGGNQQQQPNNQGGYNQPQQQQYQQPNQQYQN